MDRPRGQNALSLIFSYRLQDILEEVTKRTSYLGAMRNTQDGAHLLDRLSLTDGESFMFDEFVEEASTETYEWLKAFGRNVTHGYHVETNPVSKIIYTLAGVDATESNKHINIVKPYKVKNPQAEIGASRTVENGYYASNRYIDPNDGYLVLDGEIDENYFVESAATKITFDPIVIRLHHASNFTLSFNIYGVANGTRTLIDVQTIDYLYNPLGVTIDNVVTSNYVGVYTEYEVEIQLVKYAFVVPFDINDDEFIENAEFVEGTTVADDGTDTKVTLYQAVRDCNSENWQSNSEYMQIDPRHKITFILDMQPNFDPNMMNPIDRHIKEAIVCFIIYRWLDYTMPDEGEKWYARFEENAQKAKQGMDSEMRITQRKYSLF